VDDRPYSMVNNDEAKKL